MPIRTTVLAALAALLFPLASLAQTSPSADAVIFPSPTGKQAETDEYTRYELLAPESASFKIHYEVTATTDGAKVFYNPIRKGSVASDEAVYDAMTGQPLHFEVVSGADARRDPLLPDADPATDYIKVTLARPVPHAGQARLLIVKTYKDAKSYHTDGDAIVFDRPLGIPRDQVVLPPGYEVTSLSVPSQILTEPDGRIAISFLHAGSGEAPLVIRAVKNAQTGPAAQPAPLTESRSWESPFQGETEKARLSQRASQNRDIVYFLQQPETHAFSLYHDYTESRPGINGYANVVRQGSSASHPSAYILDTGEQLTPKEMSGAEIEASGINTGENVDPKDNVVVIPFPAIQKASRSASASRKPTPPPPAIVSKATPSSSIAASAVPRNAVVLPSGWYVTASATPATVNQLPDGRIRLTYWDDQPEPVDVLLKAKRRPTSGH